MPGPEGYEDDELAEWSRAKDGSRSRLNDFRTLLPFDILNSHLNLHGPLARRSRPWQSEPKCTGPSSHPPVFSRAHPFPINLHPATLLILPLFLVLSLEERLNRELGRRRRGRCGG